jgi:hypothetical protein
MKKTKQRRTRRTSHIHTKRCFLRKDMLSGKAHCLVTGELVYFPLTPEQKAGAKVTVAAMMKEWKKGRWKSREQAIAVGLSKARRG